MSRGGDKRWSTKMLGLQPEGSARQAGHADKRWSDELDRVTALILVNEEPGEWKIAAEDRDECRRVEDRLSG